MLIAGNAAGKIGILYKENKYGEGLAEYFKLPEYPGLQQKKSEYSRYSAGTKTSFIEIYLPPNMIHPMVATKCCLKYFISIGSIFLH